ncbi:MAG: sel1 repeat family protein [Oxalobacteraceae bacterium]|nr:MAG: sel1 repeat family protein [Oxalobacteraceae bacterium]
MAAEWTVSGPDALFDLGLQYSTGRSVPVDLIAAHKWFNLAAAKGHSDARAMRQEVAQMMPDAEIATAQRDARAWIATH